MDAVLRAGAIYIFLLLLFRISGRRTLSEITTFDFILLLIIGEATQQGLLGDDFSVTNALLVIVTLIVMDIALSLFKEYVPIAGKLLDGMPMVLVENGQPLRDRMKKARVDEYDIMEEARRAQGLERMDQIKYAVLEVSGAISIVPKD
ncbi:MAG: hypothetical protein AMXMBFR74_30700 [Parvibaculum sp.]|uniref:DUF421 domain-containing protein n=1 Tax=Parvibaculum sp. TaxID=2024848 RepID=UPI0035BAF16E